MSAVGQQWLLEFAAKAESTDRLAGKPDHVSLLAAGLIGEAGSIVAELKKERREREAYPVYRRRMLEEIGDFLWYYVRLLSLVAPGLLPDLHTSRTLATADLMHAAPVSQFLRFGASVGDLVRAVVTCTPQYRELRPLLQRAWDLLVIVSGEAGIPLHEAAGINCQKTASRWPTQRAYLGFFDEGCPEEEQFPRRLDIEFRERARGSLKAVILRCNGINFGDRLTDNIKDADGYRYHDIFHLANVVHLGWSAVVRALLRCKRKSRPEIDETQDGARAAIIEEAVAAIVFSRAKRLSFFEGLDHVDFDLLKAVKEFVEGYEVERVPLWQWESAILDGYRVFRLLCANAGGRVTLDLERRVLGYGQLGEAELAALQHG